MTVKDLPKLLDELRDLSLEEREAVLEALHASEATTETPLQFVKMSELDEGHEAVTRVVMMDRKISRKLRSGEEGTQSEIVEAEGSATVESLSAPGGTVTISGTSITGAELAKAIARDFGPACKGGGIFLSDGMYFTYSDSDVRKILTEDLTDLQLWINTYFDCDDFAQVVAGVVANQLKGIPFGTLWFKGAGIYHAVNCFYSRDDRKMKVVEPQTDGIYIFDKKTYCPMLVVI